MPTKVGGDCSGEEGERVEAERRTGERRGVDGREEVGVETAKVDETVKSKSSRRSRPPFVLMASTSPRRLKPVHLRNVSSSSRPPSLMSRLSCSSVNPTTPSSSRGVKVCQPETRERGSSSTLLLESGREGGEKVCAIENDSSGVVENGRWGISPVVCFARKVCQAQRSRTAAAEIEIELLEELKFANDAHYPLRRR
jgi:hypothetical protein